MGKQLRVWAALFIALGFLAGCNNPLQTKNRLSLFDDTFRLYSKHMRWGHYRQVTSLITQEHVPASLAKIPSLKNRRISRVEAIQWSLSKEEDKATGAVEISYYLTDQGVVRQTTQDQAWIFEDERWRLDTPLPDLP